MKILISESSFKRILREFEINPFNPHFTDRSYQRFIGQNLYDVIAIRNGDWQNQILLGKYKIPNDVKSKVIETLNYLLQSKIVGVPNRVYIIKLHQFDININYIRFNGDKKTQQENLNIFYEGRTRSSNTSVFLQERPLDEKTSTQQHLSSGRDLVCIVKGNVFQTMFLTKTNNPIELTKHAGNKQLSTDIVYIDDPMSELQDYIQQDKLTDGKSKDIPSISL